MTTGFAQDDYIRSLEDRIAELEAIIERMCHADAVVITANEEHLQKRVTELERELLSARLANRAEPDLSGVDFGAPHLRER